MPDGRVEVLAQGEPTAVRSLVQLLGEDPSTRSRPGRVDGVVVQRHSPREGLEGFAER
jgi:acylphosphatase